MNLTPKQKIFVDEYLVDLNATRSYKKAYPKVKNDNTAGVEGFKLLKNPKIDKYIQKRMAAREKRTEITQDQVLRELANIALANGTDFAQVITKKGIRILRDEDGNETGQEPYEYKIVEIAETDKLGADKRSAVAGIKQGANGIELKMNDKVKALELLGRHLGMFNDKLEIKASHNIENLLNEIDDEDEDD